MLTPWLLSERHKLWQDIPAPSRCTSTRIGRKFDDIYMKWYGWIPRNVSLVNIRKEVTGIEMNFVATQSERFTVIRTHWLATIFWTYTTLSPELPRICIILLKFHNNPKREVVIIPVYRYSNGGPEKLSCSLKAIQSVSGREELDPRYVQFQAVLLRIMLQHTSIKKALSWSMRRPNNIWLSEVK